MMYFKKLSFLLFLTVIPQPSLNAHPTVAHTAAVVGLGAVTSAAIGLVAYKINNYWNTFEQRQKECKQIVCEALQERIDFKNGVQVAQFAHSGEKTKKAAAELKMYWIKWLFSLSHPKLNSLVSLFIEEIKELPAKVETRSYASSPASTIGINDGYVCELKAEIDETKEEIEKALMTRSFKDALHTYWLCAVENYSKE